MKAKEVSCRDNHPGSVSLMPPTNMSGVRKLYRLSPDFDLNTKASLRHAFLSLFEEVASSTGHGGSTWMSGDLISSTSGTYPRPFAI
jgi:hypothetical protein